MAHKMGAGSTKNTRDSNPKRLGVKRYGAEIVKSGNILVRQREPNLNLERMSVVEEIIHFFALKDGVVQFTPTGFINIVTE